MQNKDIKSYHLNTYCDFLLIAICHDNICILYSINVLNDSGVL